MRIDGREPDELRHVSITPNFTTYAEGSVLIEMGQTRVICNTSIEIGLPVWMDTNDNNSGWVTAEYAMLPRATHTRTARERTIIHARSQEIQRLIGRSLRRAVNLEELKNHTCIVDCDVIQADGGTRTASITGGYVSLVLALKRLIQQGKLLPSVLINPVAAISVGVVDGLTLLDLDYHEDSQAQVDANIVMNSKKEYIEIQFTAEKYPFDQQCLDSLLEKAWKGIDALLILQKQLLSK